MSPVIVLALAVGAALLGFVAGGVVTGLVLRRRVGSTADSGCLVIEPDVDREIEQRARHWAVARGLPGAAPLVADKLRLIAAVRSQPARRRRRKRWWR